MSMIIKPPVSARDPAGPSQCTATSQAWVTGQPPQMPAGSQVESLESRAKPTHDPRRATRDSRPGTNMWAMVTLDFAFWDVLPHTTTGTAIADDYDAHIALAQRLEGLGWHS